MATSQHTSQSPWSIMKPVRGRIASAMFVASISSIAGILSMVFLAFMLRDANADYPWLAIRWLLLAGGCVLIAFVLRGLAFGMSHNGAFRLEYILRTELAKHLAQASMGAMNQYGAGGMAKVLYDDIKSLHVFVADSTPMFARAYVAPLATFALLLWLDWRLALVAALVLVLGMVIMTIATKDSRQLGLEYNQSLERVNTAVIEYVQAMPVVRTFDTGSTTFSRYQKAIDDFCGFVVKWYQLSAPSAKTMMTVFDPLVTLMALLWVGAFLLWGNYLDFYTWVAVLLIGTGLAESLMPLMLVKHLVSRTQINIQRIKEIQAIPVLPRPKETSNRPQDASISFEHVSFSYTPDAPAVLKDVSFSIKPGQVVALVGPSGAGKSTVARLIPRFWDVTAGRILIGGQDVRDLTTDVLTQQVSLVFQETFLFSDSIRDNIRLGIAAATDAEIEAAAKAAQAHDFIMSLPQGYDTKAGDRGVFLSGGQRQRITIARAILQNRPILLLDEATAFADPENEVAILEGLSNLMQGRTCFIIAHRLSSIRDADKILVFNQGALVEQGRHADLISQQGIYQRLWEHSERAANWVMSTHH